MTTIKENGIYKAKIKTKENGLNILSMVENPIIPWDGSQAHFMRSSDFREIGQVGI